MVVTAPHHFACSAKRWRKIIAPCPIQAAKPAGRASVQRHDFLVLWIHEYCTRREKELAERIFINARF
jgi:hypothetical protein